VGDSKPTVAVIGTRGYPSYYGGFETAVRRVAPYLAEHGWEVTVYGRRSSIRADDAAADPRVRSIITRGINSCSLSTLTFGLTAVLHAMRAKPDVALVMNVANGFWLPLLRMRGIPTVVNVDGIEWDRAKWNRVAKFVFKLGARFTAKFGNQLVFDARAIEAYWQREFGRTGVFIPYGGDPMGELPVEPGLASGKYVLMVARFVPENTVPEFFEAAKTLAAEGIEVVIVGSTGNGGDLDDRARDLDVSFPTVRWLGHLSDDQRLFSLWQHAGVYFHGHTVGGTNPALVQAMALGAPIVARDTVYNREVLGDCGGFVGSTPSAIAEACQRMLGQPNMSAALRSASRQRALKSYTWLVVSAGYEATLRAASSIVPETTERSKYQERVRPAKMRK
jgi:glycosyltransferase involved in cell wall biosynthesis